MRRLKIDQDFGSMIAKNMNALLTFLYFGYRSVWILNEQTEPSERWRVVQWTSDLLVAKGEEKRALEWLVDSSCCLKHSEPVNVQKTYVSNEYGLIFMDQTLLSHFIDVLQLNGKRMEAVLLWQLAVSNEVNKIKKAIDIVNSQLTVQDVLRTVESSRENVFEYIWEPLIFCALKQKFAGKSPVIDHKMTAYLSSFGGTDARLKATKLCDFIMNNV